MASELVKLYENNGFIEFNNIFDDKQIEKWNKILDPYFSGKDEKVRLDLTSIGKDGHDILKEFFNDKVKFITNELIKDPIVFYAGSIEIPSNSKISHVNHNEIGGWHTDTGENLQYLELSNSTISKIIEINDHNQIHQASGILRDENWFKWRLIDCPYKKDIFILKIRDQYLVAHLKFKKKFKILNVVYSTSDITPEITNVLLKFLKKNKIDLFAFISNKKGFFDSLLPGQKNLNFAFYSKDKNILNILNKDFNDLQYIDSDLDYIV